MAQNHLCLKHNFFVWSLIPTENNTDIFIMDYFLSLKHLEIVLFSIIICLDIVTSVTSTVEVPPYHPQMSKKLCMSS